jgi:putative aldouronate transport system permease protein
MLFQFIVVSLFTVFVILCVYPFYYIFIYSLSDPIAVSKVNMYFLPVHFTLSNYTQIIKLPGIFGAFLVSSGRAVIGTLVTLFVSAMFAYALTRDELPGRKIIYKITVISMYISAGLIPWYIVMLNIGMKNNILAYFLPYAVSAYFLILIKVYIEQLPVSLEESARVDGAGYFTIFIKIILPLCKPILAAVAVFSAVNQWNTWVDNFFLVNDKHFQTLQLTLLNYLRQAEAIAQQAKAGAATSTFNVQHALSPMSIKMTLTMIVAIPIILIYPVMQKYFVKGIMLGAVKG